MKDIIQSMCPNSLEEVMGFHSDTVVLRFQEIYAVDYEASLEIFNEVKKWLWLSAQRNYEEDVLNLDPPVLSMFSAMAVLDEMWHNFIICSVDYTRFCDTHFGQYLHHQVVPRAGHAKIYHDAGKDYDVPQFDNAQLRAMMMYVYRKLGEDTYNRWFETYPDIYAVDKLRALSRHLTSENP